MKRLTYICKTISFIVKVALNFPSMNGSDLDFQSSLSMVNTLNKGFKYGRVEAVKASLDLTGKYPNTNKGRMGRN